MNPRVVLRIDLYVYAYRRRAKPSGLVRRVRWWAARVLRLSSIDERATYRGKMYVELPIPPSEISTVVHNVKRLDGPCGHVYEVDEWEYRAYDNTYVAKVWGTVCQGPEVEPDDDLKELVERYVATNYRQHGWGSYPRLQDRKPYRDQAGG